VLLFALIENLEDFYVTISSPTGEDIRLEYNINWANEVLGQDVKSYGQSIDSLQTLMNLSTQKFSTLN